MRSLLTSKFLADKILRRDALDDIWYSILLWPFIEEGEKCGFYFDSYKVVELGFKFIFTPTA
jgi:hypothetical protein